MQHRRVCLSYIQRHGTNPVKWNHDRWKKNFCQMVKLIEFLIVYLVLGFIYTLMLHSKLVFFRIMTCDWKALALLRGINGAQCEYFCMWCHCSKKQICDFSSE